MDLSAVNVEKNIRQNADEIRQENPPSRLDTQALTDNVGICEYCGKSFARRVSWKRFCCDDCRKLNHAIKLKEVNHG
jgi:hypothetical protein